MKQALLKEIDRIIHVIRRYPHKDYVNIFVCNESDNGRYGREIREMVRRHIGRNHTLNGFLADELGKGVTAKLANEYRILMLKNMKKMVRKEYK